MSARTRRSLALLWTALFVLSLGLQYMTFAAPQSVLAVHDKGLFELDGNVESEPAAGDDWNGIYGGGGSAFEALFVTDQINGGTAANPDKYFTGGDSKDPSNITNWLWTTVSQPQDKNDIAHAYAAAYDHDGQLFVYFGMDRYASNGDAQVGFWFVQDSVGLNGGPASGGFDGEHIVGDVLVQIDFQNGGANPQLRVYEWVGSGGDTAGTLDQVAAGGSCATTPAGDLRCAIAATGPTNPVWSFNDKGTPGADNDIPAGGMVEGGINLTALGLDDGCFASFIAETRSSQSETSTLSDFAFGSFSLCAPPTIATQVSASTINVGESVTDVATLTGTKGTVEGTVDFYVCGPEATAPDCSTGGDKVGGTKTLSGGTATSDPFPVNDPAATGFYCFRAEYTPTAGSKYLAAEHTNLTTECFEVIPAGIDVEKTAVDDEVDATDEIGFDITVTSTDRGTAFGVSLIDELPAGFDWSIAAGYPQGDLTGLSCAIDAGKLTCTDASMPTGDSFTVRVVADTTPDDCGLIPNTAFVATTNDGDDSDDASVTVLCPDVTVEKTPDGGSVQAGDDAVFSIVVTNDGPGTAYGVTLEDDLPAGYDWTLGGADAGDCDIVAGTLSCGFGDMAAGETRTVTLTAPTSFASCAVIDNEAIVAATNEAAAQTTNNSDTGDIDVLCADILIVKTANPVGPVSAGDDIGFDVTVTNNGDGEARGVTVDDVLPAGIDWQIDPASEGWSIEAGHLVYGPATLAAGASTSVHIVGTTDAADCGIVSNTATVDTSNDGESSSTATVTVLCPDVTVKKTADEGPFSATDQIGFTVTISNIGDGTAYGAWASDPLPGTGWAIDPASEGWSLDGDTLKFAGELAADASSSVHVVRASTVDDCGIVPNTVTVGAANEAQADIENNTASDELEVLCPDVTVKKTADVTPIDAGDTASFTIEVWNGGDGTAYDVELHDTLPAGVDWVVDGTDPDGISCDIADGKLHCELGDLLPGRGENSVFIYLAGETSFAMCTDGDFELYNFVEVSASNEPDDPELAPLPNSDDATIEVECPEIGISKDADHEGSVNAGDEVGFTVTIGNTGDGTAFDVAVSDDLPGDLLWSLDTSDDRWTLSGAAGSQVLAFAGDLASGEFSSAHVTATSNPEVCGVIPNEAFLFMDEQPAGSDDAAEIVDCPNVTVTKVADDASVSAGEQIGFTIVISNEGPGKAYGAWASDPLPGTGWAIESGDEGWTLADGKLTFAGDLADDESASVHVVRDTTVEDCGTVPNTVTVGAENEAEADTDDNEASASTDVLCALIDIEKTADDESVVAGNPIGFTVTVTNDGQGDAHDVAVSDPLPTTAGLAWSIESSDEGWSIVDGELVYEADVLGAGESSSAHVVSDTTTESCAVIDNTATVTTGNDGSDEDSASTEVVCPEIDVDKTSDDADGIVGKGQIVTFTINAVVLDGPVASGTVVDTLPAGQTYVDGSQTSDPAATSFEVSADGRTLTWTYDFEMDGDPAAVITYEVTIDEDAEAADQTNVAEYCVLLANSESACATDDETVTVPELTIEKSNDAPLETIDLGDGTTVDLPTLNEGESATFTLVYTLVNGPVDNGVVTDVLPEGLAYVEGTASDNAEFTFVSYDEATRTLRWEAPTVTESGTLTYEAQAVTGASDLAQPLVNVATIDSDQTDPDSDDSDVFVPIVEAVTPPPSITPPPTDTLPASQAPSNPGFTLMLVLLGLAGFALGLGFVTPVPERVRRRDRRS